MTWWSQPPTDEAGIVVMVASIGPEVSLASQEHKGGVFTLAIIEGRAGKPT